MHTHTFGGTTTTATTRPLAPALALSLAKSLGSTSTLFTKCVLPIFLFFFFPRIDHCSVAGWLVDRTHAAAVATDGWYCWSCPAVFDFLVIWFDHISAAAAAVV